MDGFKPPHEQGKQEIVVLHLRMNGDSCKLYDKTPPTLRTQHGATIRWIIAGNCGGRDRIHVEPMFIGPGGASVRAIEPKEADVPAAEGQHLNATVNAVPKGLYRYTVKINNAPAEYDSRADEGEFYLCPMWLCG
jgi:hypothetical protein